MSPKKGTISTGKFIFQPLIFMGYVSFWGEYWVMMFIHYSCNRSFDNNSQYHNKFEHYSKNNSTQDLQRKRAFAEELAMAGREYWKTNSIKVMTTRMDLWFGARWFGFLGCPLWKGLLLRGTPIRIPNHRAPNHPFTISWDFCWWKNYHLHSWKAKEHPFTLFVDIHCIHLLLLGDHTVRTKTHW